MPKEVSIQSVFQDLVLKGMEATNAGYGRHDQVVEALKQKVLEDAQRNGQALEESKKNGGLNWENVRRTTQFGQMDSRFGLVLWTTNPKLCQAWYWLVPPYPSRYPKLL